jgi:hypothetical protein
VQNSEMIKILTKNFTLNIKHHVILDKLITYSLTEIRLTLIPSILKFGRWAKSRFKFSKPNQPIWKKVANLNLIFYKSFSFWLWFMHLGITIHKVHLFFSWGPAKGNLWTNNILRDKWTTNHVTQLKSSSKNKLFKKIQI